MAANGTQVSSPSSFYTGYIAVTAGQQIVVSLFTKGTTATRAGAATLNHVAAYDSNKTIVPASGSDSANSTGIYTVPTGISYIIITVATAADNYNMQIEATSNGVYTSYDSYWTKSTIKNENIPAINATVANPWQGKNWFAFGTSITNVAAEGKYPNYLKTLSGMTLNNYGVSGGRITNEIIAKIKATTLTSADVITLEGFVNDWYYNVPLGSVGDTTDSTFAGAIYDALTYMYANSTATIICITDHTGQLYNNIDSRASKTNTLGLRMIDYTNMFVSICEYLNVPIIKAGQKSMINEFTASRYLADQIHPNEVGGNQLANTIWDEMKNIHPRVLA
jgi:hypothetical protein